MSDCLSLKTRIAQTLHRTDLGAQLPNFIADATELINSRFSVQLAPLVLDTDTNPVLDQGFLLYLFAALSSAYAFLNDGENHMSYRQMFEAYANQQCVTGRIVELDPARVDDLPPVITPERAL